MRPFPHPLLLILLASCTPKQTPAEELAQCSEEVARLEARVRDLEKQLEKHETVLKRNGLLAPDGSVPGDPAELRCIQTSENRITLTDRGVSELQASASTLMERVEVKPAYDENLVFQGYRVDEIDPDSIIHECGLRDGDVIVKINDHVLASPGDYTHLERRLEKEARIVSDLVTAQKVLTVQLRRGRHLTTLTYTGIEPLIDSATPAGPTPASPEQIDATTS